MNFQTYTIIGASIIFLILIIWIIRVEIKFRKLLGSKSEDLDDAIHAIRKNTINLMTEAEKTEAELEVINKKLKKTISGNETIRFNPFKGTGSGSNQSFATALVNAEGDGVVISSIYSREHISVFSKPVKNMKSEYELTTEEKNALQKAKESII